MPGRLERTVTMGSMPPTHETISIARPRRSRLRCSICEQRIPGEPIHIEEGQDVPQPPRTWLLCEACNTAVAEQLTRTPARTPLRLRIAVGIVAAERHPAHRAQAGDDWLTDKQIERLLIATVLFLFLMHAVVFIIVALTVSPTH
jgi:hypothetical protein